jgi:tetratricopeptide (TPR) repeat protein
VGRFDEAVPLAEEALRIAEGGATASVVFACWGAGQVHLLKGNVTASTSRLERALTLNRVPLYFRYVAAVLGAAYVMADKNDEGLRLLEQVVEQDTTIGYVAHHARTRTFLGEAYLKAGRIADAEEQANFAMEMARRRREPGHEAYALRLLGDIALRRSLPDLGSARTYYTTALPLADQASMRPLVAHCHLGLSKLYGRMDHHEKVQEHLTIATAMYREMDMRFWLEQAEAEMRELT